MFVESSSHEQNACHTIFCAETLLVILKPKNPILTEMLTGVQGHIRCKVLAALSTAK